MTAQELNSFLEDAFPQYPRTYAVEAVTGEGILLRIPVGPEHERPGGSVSGPTMMTAADTAAWLATLSRIGPVALAVTTSLTINFMRKPSLDSDLFAHARLLKLGRRLSVTDVLVVSGEDGPVVAQASVTYSIPQ